MQNQQELATLAMHLDSNASQPLYQQLAEQLRQLIHNQRLQAGERLPSSRKLANLLNVSRTSTLNAYEQLIAEGLLITRSTAGIFVSELANIAPHPLPENSAQAGIAQTYSHVSNCFDAGADVQQFPFADWARSLASVWRKPDPSLLSSQHAGGYWPLRQAVARYLKVLRGIDCQAQQVIITAGNRDAVNLVSSVLLQHGESIAIEDPCYPALRNSLLATGHQLTYCPVDEQGMCLPTTSVNAAWMTPARQYPLGIPQSTARRIAWLEYSQQQGCWLVEDDYDSEFHYHKTPASPLFQLASQHYPSTQQRVILVGSFAKVMFRTLRISYLVVPLNLVKAFETTQLQLGALASLPVQPALADFLAHRRFTSHIRRMRSHYQQRRDFLLTQLPQVEAWFRYDKPLAGMHLLLHATTDLALNDLQLTQKLQQQGFYAAALSQHYQHAPQQGLLLGFSACEPQGLASGVRCLKQLLQH